MIAACSSFQRSESRVVPCTTFNAAPVDHVSPPCSCRPDLACAALIVLLLSFMTVRVLVLRRYMRRPLSHDLSLLTLGTGVPDMHQPRSMGVPPHIAEAFPTFTYSEEAFKSLKHYKEGSDIVVGLVPTSGAVDGVVAGAKGLMAAAQQEPPQGTAAGDRQQMQPTDKRRSDSGGSSDDSGARHVDSVDLQDAPQCSVCIANFEPGEVLRQLPCLHVYHKDCIDVWMHQHDTCPNCRTRLTAGMPLPTVPSGAPPRAGNRSRSGSDVLPASGAAQPGQAPRSVSQQGTELQTRRQDVDDADCEAPVIARPRAGS